MVLQISDFGAFRRQIGGPGAISLKNKQQNNSFQELAFLPIEPAERLRQNNI